MLSTSNRVAPSSQAGSPQGGWNHDSFPGPLPQLPPVELEDLCALWSNIPIHLLDPFPPPAVDEWVPGFARE
eukprot:10076902-Heterocapsa_arctica.AAC.1